MDQLRPHLLSDACALDELCDRYLNSTFETNGLVRYAAIKDSLWCTINLYQQAGSVPQPHEGWVEYLEITFMSGSGA